jgi:hypothetical protein
MDDDACGPFFCWRWMDDSCDRSRWIDDDAFGPCFCWRIDALCCDPDDLYDLWRCDLWLLKDFASRKH